MTRFKITFKKKHIILKAQSVAVIGDGYYTSDKNGVTSFIIFRRRDNRNEHVFVCPWCDVAFVLLNPVIDETQ